MMNHEVCGRGILLVVAVYMCDLEILNYLSGKASHSLVTSV